MKQQFKGTVNLDVANRTITLVGIELTADRVLLAVNATVGFVYHNFSIDDPAEVTVVGGNTVLRFADYKDCDVHRDSDKVAVFYEDGVDLGKLIKDESDETQALIKSEFDETQDGVSAFKTSVESKFASLQAEVKSEFDETQALIKSEFDETQTAVGAFRAEVKTEFDDTQAILNSKLPALIDGKYPVLSFDAYSPANGYSVTMTNGPYGPVLMAFSRGGVTALQVVLTYDANGELTSATPV